MSKNILPRDLSWLDFNARVLQEAADPSVELINRIKFLAIFFTNLDEFFRVRVAVLKNSLTLNSKISEKVFYAKPEVILAQINSMVIRQQDQFNSIWQGLQAELAQQNVFIKGPTQLDAKQKDFIINYYHEEVESNTLPIMLDKTKPMPYVGDQGLYLGIAMRNKKKWLTDTYAIIEVPIKYNSRFVQVPSTSGEVVIVLLEDIISFNLPYIFSYFNFDHFDAHAFQIAKNNEFSIDNDFSSGFVEKIRKAVKNRRRGLPTRFEFDKDINHGLLEFLIKKLKLSGDDSLIPANRTLHFQDFIDFPKSVLKPSKLTKYLPILHPAVNNNMRLADVLLKQDLLLAFPYHKFNTVIDLLRESAMDPMVVSIKITIYRLAQNSKIANALINAARNGKKVTVMLELRARFDETNNLDWKDKFEQEGIKVLYGIHNMKVHAKVCCIRRIENKKERLYGFVSTGNLNEQTAKFYADLMLMTSNRQVMRDIAKVFKYLENPKQSMQSLEQTKRLLVSPVSMRSKILLAMDKEIANAKAGKKAKLIVKLNSLSDEILINKLYQAIDANVSVELIIRGIFCLVKQVKDKKFTSISIVDEYLEHARVMYFYNAGKEDIYISSADWMPRNLDHRIEVAVNIIDKQIKASIKDYLAIQLKDNVKARNLNAQTINQYVPKDKNNSFRSQIELVKYYLQQSKAAK